MIESDTRAFQSPLNAVIWPFAVNIPVASSTYFNMFQPIWGRKMYIDTYFQML